MPCAPSIDGRADLFVVASPASVFQGSTFGATARSQAFFSLMQPVASRYPDTRVRQEGECQIREKAGAAS